MQLDHLAVLGATLAEASDHIEQALGIALQNGGVHPVFGTHNRLLGLMDGVYLEAISIDPNAPKPTMARWFDLDRFTGLPRLGNWICRCDNLDKVLVGMSRESGRPVELTRGALRWRMAVPDDGILPFQGAFPALIQWQSKAHPAHALKPRGCRLRRLTIAHPETAQLQSALGAFFDPRVVFEKADQVGLSATFETPHGERQLQ